MKRLPVPFLYLAASVLLLMGLFSIYYEISARNWSAVLGFSLALALLLAWLIEEYLLRSLLKMVERSYTECSETLKSLQKTIQALNTLKDSIAAAENSIKPSNSTFIESENNQQNRPRRSLTP